MTFGAKGLGSYDIRRTIPPLPAASQPLIPRDATSFACDFERRRAASETGRSTSEKPAIIVRRSVGRGRVYAIAQTSETREENDSRYREIMRVFKPFTAEKSRENGGDKLVDLPCRRITTQCGIRLHGTRNGTRGRVVKGGRPL